MVGGFLRIQNQALKGFCPFQWSNAAFMINSQIKRHIEQPADFTTECNLEIKLLEKMKQNKYKLFETI